MPPTNVQLNNATIEENLPSGTIIGDFTSIDPDGDTEFTYTLVDGEGDADNAIFSINGDELSSTQSFDFETQDSYSIRVQTDDGNGGTFEKQFTINVSDVNEEANINTAPLLQTPLGDQIVLQNQPFSFTIPTNTFSDADGDTLTYALGSIGPSLPNGITFDPNTGTFSGTTNELGAKLIEVIASNPSNANASDSFQLKVLKNIEVPDTEGSLQVDGDALDNYLNASNNNGKYRLEGDDGK